MKDIIHTRYTTYTIYTNEMHVVIIMPSCFANALLVKLQQYTYQQYVYQQYAYLTDRQSLTDNNVSPFLIIAKAHLKKI